MKKFFHVDMWSKLKSGQTIKLNDHALSVFGLNYYKKFEQINGGKFDLKQCNILGSILDPASWREYCLETFRIGAPELKKLQRCSRFNSFFALECIEDACRYIERYQFKGKANIYEVFTDCEPMVLDMTWLDQQFDRTDIIRTGYYFLEYWKGHKIENDTHLKIHEKRGSLMEVIINKDVTIGEIIETVVIK